MSPSGTRHGRLRAVFDEAVRLEPSARAAYLERIRRDAPDVWADACDLLAAFDAAGSFLEHPSRNPVFSALDSAVPFAGTARFRIRRLLGAGGMGIVYEADDHLRDEIVALKTMRRSTARDLFHLKREFRSLADVAHPNLVCLYELFVEDGRAFFTMELVDGVSLVDFVQRAGCDRYEQATHAARQLVEGVIALHRRGLLHRDIKPSNALVTASGRVVILDFGLAAHQLTNPHAGAEPIAGGTPAYMAPEEAAGAPPSEAGDWYALGVALYESLLGVLPFTGSPADVQRQKQTADPLPPGRHDPHLPPHLQRLCLGLLCRNPAQRMTGDAALQTLAWRGGPKVSTRGGRSAPAAPFVGRHQELLALDEAFGTVLQGQPALVCLHGASGIGKSALLARFSERLAAHRGAVVLVGRCYEYETIPYNALDGVVDALSRYLQTLAHGEVRRLLPADIAPLTLLFPVLRQVREIGEPWSDPPGDAEDPVRLRLRGFAALRELLHRLADDRPVIVGIDDVHWADADSVVLMRELLLARPGLPLLTLLAYRHEEIAGRAPLSRLVERAPGFMPVTSIALEPLSDDDAQRLTRELLTDSDLDEQQQAALAREAQGVPFVLEQLAWHVPAAGHETPSLLQLLNWRLDALPPPARQFLETLVVCTQPVATDVVCDACGLAKDRQSAVMTLRSQRLIRSAGTPTRVEPYHDRIRGLLSARLTPADARTTHRRLVDALVARGVDDSDVLYEHYRGAGDDRNAAMQGVRSAERAGRGLAFDRAASLYRYALSAWPDAVPHRAWRTALADALVNAGRPEDAAQAYLAAAADADLRVQVELRRRAAEQFLIGGHIDRGLELLRHVLRSVGLGAPTSSRGAVWSLLWQRALLRWRGLGYVARPSEALDADALLKVDTCWAAASGLLLVDIIGAAAYCARHLRLALDAGDPARIAKGMAFEAAARGAYPTGQDLAARMAAHAHRHARRLGQPDELARSLLSEGMVAVARGEWKKALDASEQALVQLQSTCVGVTWERNMAQNLVIWALMYLGELADVARRVPALLADARSRGNLYLATELATRSNYVWLIADDPDGGEREVAESIARWSQIGFHRQHYSALLARIQTALYRGDAAAAWQLVAAHDVPLRRSWLKRVQVLRVETHFLRARAALAMAAAQPADASRFLSVARAQAQCIARDRMPWSDPIGQLVGAGVAHLEGRAPIAQRALHDAISGFERADMRLYAAVARWRLGEIERGRDRGDVEMWMSSQSIRNPARLVAMLSPGFPDA